MDDFEGEMDKVSTLNPLSPLVVKDILYSKQKSVNNELGSNHRVVQSQNGWKCKKI